MLTPIRFSHRNKFNQSFWLYKCDCGNEKVIMQNSVRTKHTKSCGCLKGRRSHGKTDTKVYKVWQQMKNRCLKERHPRFKNYGGRGIKICDRWLKFENFLADMGEPPTPNHSLDRIDNNGNYEPLNCRWATHLEQANNRSDNLILTYKGENKTLSEWAMYFDVTYRKLQYYIVDLGFTMEELFDER